MTDNKIIYTVTVIDDSDEEPTPYYQRTPGIFTNLNAAISVIKNNESDISESGACKYAVIEQTNLDEILPQVKSRIWFKWDFTKEEYISIEAPINFERVHSFAIN